MNSLGFGVCVCVVVCCRLGVCAEQFTVVRRYSDFCWLHDQLVYAFPGAIIPPLPEKNVVRRFSQEFIEVRRRALERFLNRVAAHTELVACPHFHTFLQADDAGLAKAKEDTKQEKQKKGLVQWFDNTMTSLSSSAMNRDDIRTAADSQVEEEGQYITQLETQLQNVVKHTTILIKRNREIANALFEFGLAFTLLGQTEGDSLGAALQQVGNNADQMSVATAEQAENEAMQFEEPLQEYIRLVGAVKVRWRNSVF
jgi:sorting nexin-1/2